MNGYVKDLFSNWDGVCNNNDVNDIVTNFIQLVFSQLVDQFSQTKLHWKAPNEGYLYMCGMHKSDNKWLRYQAINSCKSFIC